MIQALEVSWPSSGIIQRFERVAANQFIAIKEGSPQYRTLPYVSGQED